jgi:hypothetical protein
VVSDIEHVFLALVPRRCVSGCALFAADLEAFDTKHDINRITQILAQVVTDWNCNKMYKAVVSDKRKEGNCQDFVDDLLDKLHVKKQFTGPVGEFFNTLRKKGTCDMVFKMDESFCQKFETEPKVKFTSHEQLDLFMKKLVDKDPVFQLNHVESWYLLKSYDRA